MANKIPTEILIKILNINIKSSRSTQDLYSSVLVNRFWCKVTIPILWELILDQECYTDRKKLRKKALCIRTYISCMDSQARTLLIQNGFDLSSSPPKATFDYPSFTHKFIINNLVYFISIYSQQIIGPNQDNNNNNNRKILITTESRILFREICELIIYRGTFFDYFKLAEVPEKFSENFRNYSDLIGSIPMLPGALKVFKKLKSFTSMTGDYELIRPLYKSLKLICDNISDIDLKFDSEFQVELLVKLISVQKRLKNLSIVANKCLDYNSIFWAIISQKETLKSLRLKSVDFYDFKRRSSPIGQFTSLQELYIENCSGLHKPNSLFFVSSFTQLSSFHYFHSSYRFNRYPHKFIIKVLENNKNLKNIVLYLYSIIQFDTFSAMLNYCTSIIELTLHNLRPEYVIAIFNNFKGLRRFSFDCGEKFDANELLCQMAENVPESLETIETRMGKFSANSLRKFFEGWCRKGGGGNKKIIVKRIRQVRPLRIFTLSDEHFEVIKEYGVEFNLI